MRAGLVKHFSNAREHIQQIVNAKELSYRSLS